MKAIVSHLGISLVRRWSQGLVQDSQSQNISLWWVSDYYCCMIVQKWNCVIDWSLWAIVWCTLLYNFVNYNWQQAYVLYYLSFVLSFLAFYIFLSLPFLSRNNLSLKPVEAWQTQLVSYDRVFFVIEVNSLEICIHSNKTNLHTS